MDDRLIIPLTYRQSIPERLSYKSYKTYKTYNRAPVPPSGCRAVARLMRVQLVLYSSRSIVRIVRFSPLLSVIVRIHVPLHAALCMAPAASRAYLRPLPLHAALGTYCRYITGNVLILALPVGSSNAGRLSTSPVRRLNG